MHSEVHASTEEQNDVGTCFELFQSENKQKRNKCNKIFLLVQSRWQEHVRKNNYIILSLLLCMFGNAYYGPKAERTQMPINW